MQQSYRGGTIASSRQAGRAYAAGFVAEDDVLRETRQRAGELGAVPVEQGAGAVLRLLAAALDARAVVEIGTGAGVSGLWLLRGMRPDGVLTTVDSIPEHHHAARDAFRRAGVAPNRTRFILGRALEVLPRLTDGGYDLVFCDADRRHYPQYLGEAIRLLRPGGMLAFDNVLLNDRVIDPAYRDPDTLAVRELHRAVRNEDRLMPALLPVGDGLLCAVKR